ncbi:adenosine kinase [Pacificimonas sp. WHA3]|uniref:Adenosine kinase n=1 Tax=Pacificimonas pallii TaxID=2827236 RepID=A0ABS6SBM7_9SPHN|nr:adenosine kinase [Pacificimonas pallii]MBV7255819.1 adenosine kinase [Pacificimonas pallii]
MPHAPIACIGNAIVDVIAPATDEFLTANNLVKGSMTLIDTAQAEALYAKMQPGREISGGSGANTAAGIAALGVGVRYVGRVADDQLGNVFQHDIRAGGVFYDTPMSSAGTPTARCLILVTPDGERTMHTFLGTSVDLGEADVDFEAAAAADLLYLEGYLWDSDSARPAMERARDLSRAAGKRTAFTLSDGFCVDRHRDSFRELAGGGVDIIFANEDELKSLYETDDFAAALDAQRGKVQIAAITRSDKGSVILAGDETIEVPAKAVASVVDTTGAGDLFASGFLAGLQQDRSLTDCARLGAMAAAEVISHYGARPEADLKALAAKL